MPLKDYTPGTICWGKLKGYPWWPSRIETEESLSQEVLNNRPKNGRTYPVLFLGSLDYGWLTPENLESFKENMSRFANRGRGRRDPEFSKALKQAETPSLLDNLKIGSAKDEFDDDDDDDDDNNEHIVEDHAPRKKARTPKAGSTKRLSDDKPGRTDAVDNDDTAARSPKRARSSKNNASSTSKTTHNGSRNSTSSSRQSDDSDKQADGDEDDARSVNGSKRGSRRGPPVSSRKQLKKESEREHDNDLRTRIRELGKPFETLIHMRYKIQKRLLKGDIPADISCLDETFARIEEFNMTRELLQETKMGKLMRRVNTLKELEDHPDDKKYRFRERAEKLLTKWRTKINEQRAESVDIGRPVNGGESTSMTRSPSLQKSEEDEFNPDNLPTELAGQQSANDSSGKDKKVASPPEAEPCSPAAAAAKMHERENKESPEKENDHGNRNGYGHRTDTTNTGGDSRKDLGNDVTVKDEDSPPKDIAATNGVVQES